MTTRLAAMLPRTADRRLLPEGRLSGPMPWVLAIMLFLTTLAAAGGLALGATSRTLGQGLADRLTIQIVEADATMRETQARAAIARLRGDPAVRSVRRVGEAEMNALLAPWLGADGTAALPLPALIDVRLAQGDPGAAAGLARRIMQVAPAARIDDHEAAMAPLAGLVRTLRLLAFALVLLMTLATACVVVLAAKAALDTHRGTIDVMHLLGATDIQIARLFQRRIAFDALVAGLIGLAAGIAVVLAIAQRLEGLGSELVGSIALPPPLWGMLAALPILATLLAMAAARWTVLRTLRRIL